MDGPFIKGLKSFSEALASTYIFAERYFKKFTSIHELQVSF